MRMADPELLTYVGTQGTQVKKGLGKKDVTTREEYPSSKTSKRKG